MNQFLLGLDIGSSSIKASLVDAETGLTAASAQSPAEEMAMIAVAPGWAEQDPELWWKHLLISVKTCLQKAGTTGDRIAAIGISYQMHGLVLVDKDHKPLRPSIIWCDSRAVSIGDKAMKALGEEYALSHFLNSPGNFTASKLRWVKENEPAVFSKVHKFMLPGDYIAMRLTGEIVTTDTGLSEGVFWDYPSRSVSGKLLEHYGFDPALVPVIKPVFSVQGEVKKDAAVELGLKAGTRVAYRSGDQPNNAFSLNVLNPGETAATAGTSGVIYSVTDQNAFDVKSRVNTFIHVNNSAQRPSNGVLLCVNGTGILNSWLRRNTKSHSDPYDYTEMNRLASKVPIGAEGLTVLPFGNGAERILENKSVEASFHGLNFNRHSQGHIFRAAQEGIVFALKYGFDILQGMGLKTNVIRAGNANMFLSPLFREAFVNAIGARLELYDTDGAKGAALGAGVGAGIFKDFKEAFRGLQIIESEEPDTNKAAQYHHAYTQWKTQLQKYL
ncbi:carbohydrate kinase [Fulvivirgaceae bacterium PWU4]|uniref:Carbohydrate kinase n=1 Tax=Chryseosolibacter histidini TaxID=2782349 RepID=A0AAP2DIB7_9BACT|nr:FGGY family carbohydrate kinase [Chryseosolibacter histidini]MBT1696845.1 carbohydrate kinase [Chryseosolibacter histidini]